MLSRSVESAEENPCPTFDPLRRARETRSPKDWLLVDPSDRSTGPVSPRQDRHRIAKPRSADVRSPRRKPWPCAAEYVSHKRENSLRSAPPALVSAPRPERVACCPSRTGDCEFRYGPALLSVSIRGASSRSAKR